jgi:betaine-aldehyde dehydrogenase
VPSIHIDGKWVTGSGAAAEVIDPADGSVVETVDTAGPAEVDAAVAAARAAFDDPRGWRATPVAERAALLRRVADLLQRDREAIAHVETRDTGKTLRESRIDVDDVTAVFRYYADLAAAEGAGRLVDVGMAHVQSQVVAEPVGVCALITPWNYPLLQLSWKLAPALVAGNTCVIKPSEVTPLTSVMLVRLTEEAGVPPGVVNILLGTGPAVGAPLSSHDDVDMVSFTGGLATGQAIIRASAATVKRVAVELGGKNPDIVFADAVDALGLETVVDNAATAVFLHSGQVCSAGTRLIVEDSVADAVVAGIVGKARAIRVGPGLDPASETGPLVSAAHRAKIEDFVASARAEGANVLAGGARPDDPALAGGFYYLPTVLDGCHRGMRVVREETFGPLLTVERFAGEDEALMLGNDTAYGLAGGVWTGDPGRARRMASGLRHGTVWVNDYGPYVPAAEWGGMKRSGNGRELGPTGLHEYQELKHVWHNTAPAPARWFGTEGGQS